MRHLSYLQKLRTSFTKKDNWIAHYQIYRYSVKQRNLRNVNVSITLRLKWKPHSHFLFPFSFCFFFSIFISTSIQSTFYIGRESKYWTITNEKSFLSEKPVTFHEMTKLFCESWSISPLLFAIILLRLQSNPKILFLMENFCWKLKTCHDWCIALSPTTKTTITIDITNIATTTNLKCFNSFF